MTRIPHKPSPRGRQPDPRDHNAKPVLRIISPREHENDRPLSSRHPLDPLADNLASLRVRHGESRRLLEKRIADESRRAAINPELQPYDPRWILATQTIQSLQGPALNPAKRSQILRNATRMGIRPFDANLVIAIVQDQARQNDPSNKNRIFKFKHADLADRLQIIPRLGVPSIRNLALTNPPIPKSKRKQVIRIAILATATLALASALLNLLLSWFFNAPT